MPAKFKDETGCAIHPTAPTRSVATRELITLASDRAIDGDRQSFGNENSPDQSVELSVWDNEGVTAGSREEGADISEITPERCKVAPSDDERILQLDAVALTEKAEIAKVEKYRTAPRYRLGIILLELRLHFSQGWEDHLRALEIEETLWKRAKCLAEYFESEEKCRDIPLNEALKSAGWGTKQQQNRRRRTSSPHRVNRESSSLKAGSTADSNSPPTQTLRLLARPNDEQPFASADEPSNLPDEPEAAASHFQPLEITPTEVEAATSFVQAIGSLDRALVVLTANNTDKEHVKSALSGLMTAARRSLDWNEIMEIMISLKAQEQGVEAMTL